MMQKFFALILFAGLPALVIFLVVFALTGQWAISLLLAAGMLGLGLDVCLRGK